MKENIIRGRSWVLGAAAVTLIVAGVNALIGCGLGLESDDDIDVISREKAEKLEREYREIAGRYEGNVTFTINGQPLTVPGHLNLQTVLIFEGRSESGRPIQRPILVARYQLNDVVLDTDYRDFQGSFVRDGEGGELTLALPDVMNPAAGVNIRGQISWDRTDPERPVRVYQGYIVNQGGVVGTFWLRHVGPPTAPVDPTEELRQRLTRMYAPLEGVYRNRDGPGRQSWATYDPRYPDKECSGNRCVSGIPFEIDFVITPERVSTPSGTVLPIALKARAAWLNTTARINWRGTVRFSPLTGEVQFVGLTESERSQLSATGVWRDGVLRMDQIHLNNVPFISFTGRRM